MKRLLVAALSLGLVGAAHAAPFEGVIEMKIDSSAMGAPGTIRTSVSKAGWRSEMEMSGPAMAPAAAGKSIATTLFAKAAAPDTIYNVNDAAKTYAVIDAREMRERAAKMDAAEKKWTVKRLGKDKIAGWGCDKIEATETGGDRLIEACLSSEIGAGDWARQFQRDNRSRAWIRAAHTAGVDGFPLRVVSSTRDVPESRQVMEVTKIERKQVPASMFEVPAGYTKTSVIGAFGQNAEEAKQLEQVQKAMQDLSPEQRKTLEKLMKQPQGQ